MSAKSCTERSKYSESGYVTCHGDTEHDWSEKYKHLEEENKKLKEEIRQLKSNNS